MSASACVLCGLRIDGTNDAVWKREFRAVYIKEKNWDQVKLSGVGICESSRWTAPIDPKKRYDDRPLARESCVLVRPELMSLKDVLHQHPSQDTRTAWGFIFHPTCWTLLVSVFKPCLRDAMSACLSVPCRVGNVLDWGHDYGGAYKFPPNRALMPSALPRHRLPENNHMKFNPVDIPELQDLLQSLKASGPARPDEHNKSCVQAPGKTFDCFARLPQEIVQEFLILSQSKDVASFRIASRTIATFPLSARFWKSRFSEGYEYHYIIEAHGSKPGSWRAFYDGVSRIQTSPGLINRKRLWNSALQLRNTLEQINGPCHGRSLCSFFEPDSTVDNADWFSARYGSTGPEGMFLGGVRVLRIRVFDVPAKFHRLFVSFVQLNHGTFISGFRFQQRNGDETLVGYIHRSREVPLPIPSQLDIYGWHLAFHESGIKAIAAVMEDETVSSWVGEHAGSSKRRLVGNLQRLSTLKAEFDALKLVSLSLPLPDKQFSVRDLYLWSPEIPRQGVQFNGRGGHDANFNAGRRNISIIPYATVEFGGTHGQDNSQLIEIVGWAFGTPDDFGIQFIYTDPSKNKSIGRVKPLVDRCSRLNLRYSRTPFSIDGPGGEMITSIQVAKREGPILKIQTNLAREVVFSPLMSYTYNGPLTVIKPSGNTVIGFYYVLGRELKDMGLMSVDLDLK